MLFREGNFLGKARPFSSSRELRSKEEGFLEKATGYYRMLLSFLVLKLAIKAFADCLGVRSFHNQICFV